MPEDCRSNPGPAVERPPPPSHRAPAPLAHQRRARCAHGRGVHGTGVVDGPTAQGVRHRCRGVSTVRRTVVRDRRGHRTRRHRSHSPTPPTRRAPPVQPARSTASARQLAHLATPDFEPRPSARQLPSFPERSGQISAPCAVRDDPVGCSPPSTPATTGQSNPHIMHRSARPGPAPHCRCADSHMFTMPTI